MTGHLLLFAIKNWFFLVLILKSAEVFAAACCGGGLAAPAMVLGDERAQGTLGYTFTEMAADVGSDSLWRKRESFESRETFKLDGAQVFFDRWQAGASVSVVRRRQSGDSFSGIGDIGTTLAYEVLPEWEYNPWKPRGWAYLTAEWPTGKSIFEDSSRPISGVGRGLALVGIGAVLTKIVARYDGFLIVGGHRSIPRSFSNQEGRYELTPGWGGDVTAGMGLNSEKWRVGGALSWAYEDPIRSSGAVESAGAPQRYVTARLSLVWLAKDNYSISGEYFDQTLVGSPSNTTLGRGISVTFQRRWLR